MQKTTSAFEAWRFNHKIRTMKAGKTLRIEVQSPELVHWSADQWKTVQDTATRNPGVDIQVVDLPTLDLPAGTTIDFTFYWPEAKHWEGQNFSVQINQKGNL